MLEQILAELSKLPRHEAGMRAYKLSQELRRFSDRVMNAEHPLLDELRHVIADGLKEHVNGNERIPTV